MSDLKTCTRCVMDTSVEDIKFDELGVCNYCKKYEQRVANEILPEDERIVKLNKLVAKIKEAGKNNKYDCVIGLSGGVDSSYVAHLIKELGLRALSVHLDNGWNTELSKKNMKNIVEKLNLDLIEIKVDEDEFYDLQKAFIKSSIENLELPTDHAITSVLLREADKRGIKYVLSGSNLVTEGILPIRGGRSFDHKLILDIQSKFGTKELKTYPLMSAWEFAYKILIKKMKYVSILNLVPYEKEKVLRLLEEKYDYVRYVAKHYESIYTRFFQGYMLLVKYKYDKRIAHLSTLVMSGQITRDEALNELKKNPYPDENIFKEDFEIFLKKLNFTQEEFDKIMKQKPAKPTDFNSLERLIKALSPFIQRAKEYAKSN